MNDRRKPQRVRRFRVGERVLYTGRLFDGLGDVIHSDKLHVSVSFDLGVLRVEPMLAKVILARRGGP